MLVMFYRLIFCLAGFHIYTTIQDCEDASLKRIVKVRGCNYKNLSCNNVRSKCNKPWKYVLGEHCLSNLPYHIKDEKVNEQCRKTCGRCEIMNANDDCVDKGLECENYIRIHTKEKFLRKCKNDRIKAYCKKSCGVCRTGERKVVEMKSEGLCRDFGHDDIMTLAECKVAAKAVGKKFVRRTRKIKLPGGCLGYGYKAYYNEPYRHPGNEPSPRSKRSTNMTQQNLPGHKKSINEDEKTIRKSRARQLRKRNRYRNKGVLHICYEKEVIETCRDGVQNQNEIGTDCGGPCSACPTCDDGILNQNETNTDCGGPCIACPTCQDRVQNQNETEIDCGGPCSPCPTCSDGILNQNEIEVDCGGTCAPCPTCHDNIQNQNETGKDCGGPCSACRVRPMPQICKWSEWTEHPCTATCGIHAIKMKSRKKLNPFKTNNSDCEGHTMKIESCHHPKCPVGCNDSSKMCHIWKNESWFFEWCKGIHKFDTAKGYFGGMTLMETCKHSCDGCHVNGYWDNWEMWSRCSVSCGLGVTVRRRKCNKPKTEGHGKNCLGKDIEISPCNDTVSCVPAHKNLSVWKNLGNCQAVKHGSTCGPGLQSQVRNCTNGTQEICADEELERNISCFKAGTSLPDCASSFEEDFECKVHSDCKDKNVNNCQHGYCMCGDHGPCSRTTDTCVNATNGGTIYDATCTCGQNMVCSMYENCQEGNCHQTEQETSTSTSSIGDSIETYTTSLTNESTDCDDNEFRCNDGKCISNDYVCDDFEDCLNWEDELPPVCPCDKEKQFACEDGTQCINIHAKCNQYIDCKDGSDEHDSVCT